MSVKLKRMSYPFRKQLSYLNPNKFLVPHIIQIHTNARPRLCVCVNSDYGHCIRNAELITSKGNERKLLRSDLVAESNKEKAKIKFPFYLECTKGKGTSYFVTRKKAFINITFIVSPSNI